MDWLAARRHELGYDRAHAPLAVSGPRGVACVLVGLQRIVLLDLVGFHCEAYSYSMCICGPDDDVMCEYSHRKTRRRRRLLRTKIWTRSDLLQLMSLLRQHATAEWKRWTVPAYSILMLQDTGILCGTSMCSCVETVQGYIKCRLGQRSAVLWRSPHTLQGGHKGHRLRMEYNHGAKGMSAIENMPPSILCCCCCTSPPTKCQVHSRSTGGFES